MQQNRRMQLQNQGMQQNQAMQLQNQAMQQQNQAMQQQEVATATAVNQISNAMQSAAKGEGLNELKSTMLQLVATMLAVGVVESAAAVRNRPGGIREMFSGKDPKELEPFGGQQEKELKELNDIKMAVENANLKTISKDASTLQKVNHMITIANMFEEAFNNAPGKK